MTVTLNEDQGHPNWYQNAEFSSLYPHTKFERNWSVNVWMQANVKSFFNSRLNRFFPLNTDLTKYNECEVRPTNKLQQKM